MSTLNESPYKIVCSLLHQQAKKKVVTEPEGFKSQLWWSRRHKTETKQRFKACSIRIYRSLKQTESVIFSTWIIEDTTAFKKKNLTWGQHCTDNLKPHNISGGVQQQAHALLWLMLSVVWRNQNCSNDCKTVTTVSSQACGHKNDPELVTLQRGEKESLRCRTFSSLSSRTTCLFITFNFQTRALKNFKKKTYKKYN